MAILDKNLLLSEIEERLNNYVPANMVKQILNDAMEAMTMYEVTRLKPDGGGDETDQLINLFLNAKEIEGRSGKTIARYRYILKKLHDGVNAPFDKITVYHIRQYMMKEKDRGVSLSTIKGNAWVYNSCFSWLYNEGLIKSNPTANLGQIKVKKEEEMPFSGEQIQLLKENAENECEAAIIHFLLSTGCRISETCSVNRNDIDFANLKLDVLGKGNKVRTVYIDNVTAMMLKRYLATRTDIDPALFYATRSNGRYTDNGIRAMLNRIAARANVPNVHPHRFRRTLATNLIDRGMNIQEVAEILGHTNIDTTMGYIHLNKKNAENAYRKYACM
jgi:site-specific recombinase XerD